MLILALDSTAVAASVAVTQDERLLALYHLNNGNTHSETLLPMVESIMTRLGRDMEEVDLFAVSSGPGSFTGVRIGAATIKGLAFGRNKPCVGVSTLEALAGNLLGTARNGEIVCPVMNARRGQVYNALFRVTPDGLERLTEDRAISVADLEAELVAMDAAANFPVHLVGDGVAVTLAYASDPSDPSLFRLAPPLLREQNAYSVAMCALRAARAGKTVSDTELAPVYLRPCQAERERMERLQTEKQA
ncbi:MAG: tRNA (adenosine(37)-N6)-threonylcarbamoyltransferase complex dimerization subunit type 1 TsaB [Ruminococcaceae bacterium]|nr:tRNA (adenosine(37)-N6)-threonylcarbamoyltransferase complex dimerization subunit type 1 TsaB [Oscillospiraceae bacterium]